ncbi:MAG: FAD-binding oxidoreductase [Solirubrobacterales bacterium]|nr:FAD-binding oxidoreductase [Solirubrobacterales bacterium]MBV9368158.1 FAD-binding oxidoreductase [Solirubrobacterales bacterium]MBV9809289.1 FAD-binding oxidoreductase [Solirubrobacterales bacterium]
MSPHDTVAQRRIQAVSAASDLRSLRAAMAGTVVGPADAGWDAARQAWALAVDQQPAAVALPESAADIVAIVNFARERGLRVAPQATGHNAHPLEHRLANAILVKTERMRAVDIDPTNRRARAESGAVWMDVIVPAAEHGLAAMAGSSPDVGVVGYTLGGGISWLSRRYGLAANSVTAVEVVTPDGTHLRTDRDQHPDLFWALRGGGGSFGIVTAIEIELRPITRVYAGAMFWPQGRAREVLQAWREWTQQELPDEVISVGRVLNIPPFPEIPEPLRGRSFVALEAVYLGDEAEGAELISPLRALAPEIDTFSTVPAAALSHLHMDPDHPVPGKGDGMLFSEMPAKAIDAFVAAATGDSGSALLSAEIRQLGGAIARPAPEHGALGSIDAPYIMFAVGMTPTPELRDLVQTQVAGMQETLSPWSTPHFYMNFSERAIDSRLLYPHAYTYHRLRAIKAEYDPGDMIQSNHPIPPAR